MHEGATPVNGLAGLAKPRPTVKDFAAARSETQPSDALQDLTVSIDPSTVLRVLTGIAAVLLTLHLIVAYCYLVGFHVPGHARFYMEEEANLPTFFSSLILLIAAVLLALIAATARRARDAFWRHWALLAMLFLALAVDETPVSMSCWSDR